MDDSGTTSISQANTDEGIGEFWDSHDFTDYDTDAPDVDFTVTFAVRVEVNLFSALQEESRRRGVNVETLVNLWLQEKLAQKA